MNLGFAGSAATSTVCVATPVAIFKLKEITLACLSDGHVLQLKNKQVLMLRIPDCRIISADVRNQTLAVGTTAGLVVLDLEKESVAKVTNYRGVVGKVKFHTERTLFASFVDLKNEALQYRSYFGVPEQLLFTVVQLDCANKFAPVSEAPGVACSGLFDTCGDELHVPEPGQIKKYRISESSLKEMPPEPLRQRVVAPSHFIANELLVSESGLVWFFTDKSINFEQRVNFVRKQGQNYYFGLQCGQIRMVNQELMWAVVFQSKQEKEVCCWDKLEADDKAVVGLGSIQRNQSQGCVIEAVVKVVGGVLQMTE